MIASLCVGGRAGSGPVAIAPEAAYKRTGTVPPKAIITPSTLFLPDTSATEFARRKALY